MAIRPLNSIAGFSTGDPAVTVIQANADVTTINLTANGVSNLGPVSNLILTGGNNGQFIQTDGAGNLSFATVDTSIISNGNSNVSIPSANGNVEISVAGNANVAVFTGTGANLLNLDVIGVTDLGNVGNVHIDGGNSGQFLKTDGNGNLSWDSVGNITSNTAAPMPYFIAANTSFIVNEFKQGLYAQPIEIDGELVVDGMLIEISDTVQSSDNQILFDFNGVPTGNAGFEFQYWDGNLKVPGNINVTGSIIPSLDDTFDLGTSNLRWRNGYFGGNTIYIGNSIISTDASNLVFESGSGATLTVTGDANTSIIENGTSNITIDLDGDIRFGVGGVPNVLILTSNGIDYDGNFVVNGNITANGGNVTGNVVTANTINANVTLTAGNVKTDNLLYANGQPWDLQQPGGSNTQLQFNDADSFGGSSALTFNKTSNVLTLGGNLVSSNANLGNAASANFFVGNGYYLSGINPGNIGVVANANYAAFAGNVVTASQPNITTVGTLTDLSVSGNGIIGGNLVVNGNLIYVNVEELSIEDPIINLNTGANGAAPVSNSGKDVGTALNYYDTQARVAFMGWDTSNAEFAFGSQTSISSEVVTFTALGNIRAQTFKGNIEAGTIAGNLTTATQSNITTVGTLGSLAVSANITAGNVVGANVISANYLVSNSGCVSINGAALAYDSGTGAAGIFSSLATDINFGLAANITAGSTTGTTTLRGNVVVNNNVWANSGTVKGSLLTGTLTTASQPNITSVGTLTSLNVSGNISGNNSTANTVTTNSTISKRGNINVVTDTVIDSFPVNAYRTAKYVVKSENDNGYESLEVLLIHNNINSYVTVYAAINDGGGNTVSITTGISSGNVELRATGLAANTVVNLIGIYVPD